MQLFRCFFILLMLTSLSGFTLKAQMVSIEVKVSNGETHQPLPGATLRMKNRMALANDSGMAIFTLDGPGRVTLLVSHVGFEDLRIAFEAKDTTVYCQLQPLEEDDEPVIVTSTRTNSRIEDLPTKVEVLGREEMDEENGIKPGNIASILGDFAGIQIQQTNAATGNADMRIQGLPGKYTQMLRDGMPLYGGFGSSFNMLQIPPLDLQQIELIKGSSSTLYGGGAIAGMVNLVSKKPVLHKKEMTATINQSTLNESNANLFLSGRNQTLGYTLFAGGTHQKAVDVNSDGFSDVAKTGNLTFHPRMFWYAGKASTVTIGYSLIYENREGGDMLAIDKKRSAAHPFYIRNKSYRNTIDGIWDRRLSTNANLTTKGSVSFYNRQVNTNVFGMHALQTTGYGELTYNKKMLLHNLVAGFNYYGDYLNIRQPDSSHLKDQSSYTFGCFIQDDWQLSSAIILQAGIRADGYHYEQGKKAYVLPRLSLKYQVSKQLTARVGGGLGYKTPTVFNTEIDERDYKYLAPLPAGLKAETSGGLNADLNFKTQAGPWRLTMNQAFYFTRIHHPLLYKNVNGLLTLYNEGSPLSTTGTETYIMAKHDPVEIYFGYTYTNARRQYDPLHKNLPLTAHHKMASLISTEIGDDWRVGIESSYIGRQYLDDGSKTRAYVLIAAMVRYDLGKISIVLNGENLLDFRQNKKETVVFPPYTNPRFPELWAPADGRVINLSVQLKL